MPIARFEIPATVDVALWFIKIRPGIEQRELSEAMFEKSILPQVNGDCGLLEGMGLIERRGSHPTRLYLKSSH